MESLVEESIEIRAIKYASRHYEKAGWRVMNVSRARGNHAGYDLFLEKDSEQLKVEVKGSSKTFYGIPDLYHSEIDPESNRLIADELCVVYFPTNMQPRLARIPREAIPPDAVVPKHGYRIRAAYKNKKAIQNFLIGVDEVCL
jgi:hypothetical protein